MTILLLIIALSFTAWMLASMVRPFLATRQDQMSFEILDQELRQIESLVARKVALVQALRDIEYDHQTNKISTEDYERFKRSCERQAVGVMRKLNTIHGGEEDWDATIDEAVLARLDAESTPDLLADEEDAPEDLWVPEDEWGQEEEPGLELKCTHCGKPLAEDDLFCSKCGTAADNDETTDTAGASTHSEQAEEEFRPAEVTG